MVLLIILILQIHECSVSFHVFVLYSVSFISVFFIVYQIQVFYLLLKFIPEYFILLNEKSDSGIIFLIYLSSSLLEKAMAPHSSTLAWKIPWMEEPGRLQSMG